MPQADKAGALALAAARRGFVSEGKRHKDTPAAQAAQSDSGSAPISPGSLKKAEPAAVKGIEQGTVVPMTGIVGSGAPKSLGISPLGTSTPEDKKKKDLAGIVGSFLGGGGSGTIGGS